MSLQTTIDFSLLNNVESSPAINKEVAYLRQQARKFIHTVDIRENLQTQQVVPLPVGTWNATYVLQPANIVLKLSPWSSQFEADFLRIASQRGLKVPAFIGYGTIEEEMLPHASYTLMEYIPNTAVPGQLLEAGLLAEHDLLAIGKEIGSLLARLHTERFGYLRSFGNVKPDWGACLGLWELKPYDLAYATWPWWYGLPYMETVVEAYRQEESSQYNALLFYTSLLCVAYLMSSYGHVKEHHKELIVNLILARIEHLIGGNG